jgi:hypothetical protein
LKINVRNSVGIGMWSLRVIEDARAGTARFALLRDAGPAGYSDVIEAWRLDADFRAWFNDELAGAGYDVFRWETPPITTANAGRPFEFALLDSPWLDERPDPADFAEYLRGAAEVATFPNLGADAILIAPRPLVDMSAYGHLGAFVRHAPEAQRQALWQAVGDAMARRIGARPVWLSTAGGGVPWLHVRLDDRPKYYGFAPYRSTP